MELAELPPPPTAPPATSLVSGSRRAPRVPTFVTDRMAVEDVSIAYGSRFAVKDVSLPIREGEVLALIGPSGCGKTTLLRTLNRLTELTPSARPRRPRRGASCCPPRAPPSSRGRCSASGA